MTRPTQALINLDALRHNFRLAQSLAPASQTLAVIKADGYGHGALAVARALESQAPALAVASVDEALTLREAGIALPVLLLEGPFSRTDVEQAGRHGFWLMVENGVQAEAVAEARLQAPVRVWLKVDTGMHRLGATPASVPDIYRILRDSGKVEDEIVFATHLACADELDNPFTHRQVELLRELARPFGAPLSIANSPGLLAWEATRARWNRPGFMLYGNSPFTVPHAEADRLRPVMTFSSRVISVRRIPAGDRVGYGGDWQARRSSLIATIPAGYGDGYPRTAPSGTPVLVAGHRAPLAGRVSMDLITVDVTDLDDVGIGSDVELWGEHLSVNEVAAGAGTIGYELLARMPARVPRVYNQEPAE
jgi:alanine racemase